MKKDVLKEGFKSLDMVAPGTFVEGEINSQGDIRIDGSFTGKIRSTGRLVIGEHGSFSGDVSCPYCEIRGSFIGIINTSALKLNATAHVEGNIYTSKISVEPGAVWNGTCNMEM